MGNYEHDPYASGGSDYAKDPYAGGGSAYAHDPYRGSSPAPKKSGGGIFGHAAHWVAPKAGLAAHDLKTIPAASSRWRRLRPGRLRHRTSSLGYRQEEGSATQRIQAS